MKTPAVLAYLRQDAETKKSWSAVLPKQSRQLRNVARYAPCPVHKQPESFSPRAQAVRVVPSETVGKQTRSDRYNTTEAPVEGEPRPGLTSEK